TFPAGHARGNGNGASECRLVSQTRRKPMLDRRARLGAVLAACLTLGLAATPANASSPGNGTIVAINANQSSNWGGYNQGAIEKGTLFNSIGAQWTVPTATQH